MKSYLPTAFGLAIITAATTPTQANVLGDIRRALLQASASIGEDAKRCLQTSDDGSDSTCNAIVDTLLSESEQFTTSESSEASIDVSSPASVEADILGSDMGEPQVVDVAERDDVVKTIEEARVYMQETVLKDETYAKVRHLCKNENSQCAFWASLGECDKNPGYMKVHCAPVCQSCEMKHVETRCPLDPEAEDALEPGDLNRMFETIVSDPYYHQFEPIVLSRPDYAPGDGPDNADYEIGLWMVMFDKALSDEEADRLIELGGLQGYERSSDVGDEKEDGTHDKYVNRGRTSTNAWCTDECEKDPVAINVMDRIANITHTKVENSESLQLLRYQNNQFYQTHNDYIPYQLDRPCGVRILTFYCYLNDVEEGGGTNFPKANGLTVTPKKGRAVLWPSVFDSDPNRKDVRSDHQALPTQGIKYGANAWIHMRDFKNNNLIGCT